MCLRLLDAGVLIFNHFVVELGNLTIGGKWRIIGKSLAGSLLRISLRFR